MTPLTNHTHIHIHVQSVFTALFQFYTWARWYQTFIQSSSNEHNPNSHPAETLQINCFHLILSSMSTLHMAKSLLNTSSRSFLVFPYNQGHWEFWIFHTFLYPIIIRLPLQMLEPPPYIPL